MQSVVLQYMRVRDETAVEALTSDLKRDGKIKQTDLPQKILAVLRKNRTKLYTELPNGLWIYTKNHKPIVMPMPAAASQ
jgi:hypothetical protein